MFLTEKFAAAFAFLLPESVIELDAEKLGDCY